MGHPRRYPHPDFGRGYPPLAGWGYLCPGQVPGQDLRGEGEPQLEQHSVYLLCSRWYASCVHAAGLSSFQTKMGIISLLIPLAF